MTPFIALVAPFAATSSSKTSSSSNYSLLIIIALFAAVYFLFMRPRSQAMKRQREEQRKFSVGDEVLTAGGIVGRVIDDQGERITLETSVGASFTVLRQYIVRRIEEPEPEVEPGPEAEAEPEVEPEPDSAAGEVPPAADGDSGEPGGSSGDGDDGGSKQA